MKRNLVRNVKYPHNKEDQVAGKQTACSAVTTLSINATSRSRKAGLQKVTVSQNFVSEEKKPETPPKQGATIQ